MSSPASPPGSAPSAAPAAIGRYRIVRPLGSGAMGDVFLAQDPNIDRLLAIKTVRLVGANAEDLQERTQRLLREAKAAGRILHPNAVTLFDAGEADGLLYLAFEFVDGPDLSRRVRTPPPLTLREVLRLTRQVAEALETAHRRGIVHRDVKPSNILLASDGEAKVADFGIAKLTNQTELTRSGSVVGSPQYMSPEQIRGEELDGRSDLFSVGVLLYELLTRARPFDGETLSTLVFQILAKEPTAIEALHPGLAPRLVDLVRRLMAKSRDDRPVAAGDVARELQALELEIPAAALDAPAAPASRDEEATLRMGPSPTPTPPLAPVPPFPPPSPPSPAAFVPPTPPTFAPPPLPPPAPSQAPRPRHGLAWLLVLLVAGGLGAGGVVLWRRARPADKPPVVAPPGDPAPPSTTPQPAAPPPSAAPPPAAPPSAAPPPAAPPPASAPPASPPRTPPPAPAPSPPPAAPPPTPPPPSTRPSPPPVVPPPAPPPPPAATEGDGEEARFDAEAARASRTMTTGLALQFEVEPADAIVKTWKRGDRRSIVQGNVGAYEAGEKDSGKIDLEAGADYLVYVIREGQPELRILVHASGERPAGKPDVIRAAARGASRGPKLVVVSEAIAFHGRPADAKVYLDGRLLGRASEWPGGMTAGSKKNLQVEPGDHLLRLEAPGYEPLEIRLEVRAGAPQKKATVDYEL